jgi:hypothetical protein
MSIEVPWFCIMIGVLELLSCLDVKITTFESKKTTFVVYLILLSPIWSWAFPFFYVKIIQMQVKWSTKRNVHLLSIDYCLLNGY